MKSVTDHFITFINALYNEINNGVCNLSAMFICF